MCSLHRTWCIILFPQHTCCPSALLCSILDEFIIISIIITIIINIIMAGLVLWSGYVHPKRKSLPQRAHNLNRRDLYLCKSMLALQECLLQNTSAKFVLGLTKIGLSAGFLHRSAFNQSVLQADWTWRCSHLKISWDERVWCSHLRALCIDTGLTSGKYDVRTKNWIYTEALVNKQHSHRKLSKLSGFFFFTFRVSLNGRRVENCACKIFLIIEASRKQTFIRQIYLKFTGLGNSHITDGVLPIWWLWTFNDILQNFFLPSSPHFFLLCFFFFFFIHSPVTWSQLGNTDCFPQLVWGMH